MFDSTAVALTMNDPADRLDARVWRAILLTSLARSGEGILVCSPSYEILFSTPRAAHALERLNAMPAHGHLHAVMVDVIKRMGAKDRSTECISISRRAGSVYLDLAVLRDLSPALYVIRFREDLAWDHELYEKMRKRFGTSRRGFQITQLLRRGLTNREIAGELRLAEATIKVYVSDLLQECGVSTRTALVVLVERLGNLE